MKPTRVWTLSLTQQAYCQQQCLCRCDTFDANMFSDRKRKELGKVEEEEHLNCSSGLHFDGTSSFTGTVKRPVTETLAMWSGHSSTETSLISSSSSSSR